MTFFYQKLKAGNNLRDSLFMTQQDFRNGVIKSDDPYIDWRKSFIGVLFQLSGDSTRLYLINEFMKFTKIIIPKKSIIKLALLLFAWNFLFPMQKQRWNHL